MELKQFAPSIIPTPKKTMLGFYFLLSIRRNFFDAGSIHLHLANTYSAEVLITLKLKPIFSLNFIQQIA